MEADPLNREELFYTLVSEVLTRVLSVNRRAASRNRYLTVSMIEEGVASAFEDFVVASLMLGGEPEAVKELGTALVSEVVPRVANCLRVARLMPNTGLANRAFGSWTRE